MIERVSPTKWPQLYRFERPSFVLLVLPYIAFNYKEFLASPFFSITSGLLLLVAIIGIDLVMKAVSFPGTKTSKALTILFVSATVLFFYGYYFLGDIQQLTLKKGHIPVRMRTIFILLFLLVALIQFVLFKKRWLYKLINVYLLIFSLLVIMFPGHKREKSSADIRTVPMHPLKMADEPGSIKPVILIIADEYQSPKDMAEVMKDSSLLNFSDSLSTKNWITKNQFTSLEWSTIYSISSLMNFNLSENTKYSQQNVMNIGIHKLSHPALQDSLLKKNVSFINYGIFDLGKQAAFNRLYFYPRNFVQHFLIYTSFYVLKYSTGGFNIDGFQEKFSPFEAHNKKVLETLADTLSQVSPRTFVYAHLMMPHKPFQHNPDFPLRITNNISDYKDYWAFSNRKIAELLQKLTAENKYRIIITGDHGYRRSDSLNPRNTFSAFYQFDSAAVSQVHSVQDLGSLVNACFN
ncbi:MAG TPA: sulfatase-like hydrolase/transferase [Flavitalea sp.]|nr:sulfatase-like hydrolase/transferase [Flavitalea sp.]